MWLRTKVEAVLLAMTIKPFLSHRRQNATAVRRLRDALRVYGAGGWLDTEDLGVGERTTESIHRAIYEETGGFIWWGTRAVLDSSFVNTVEIPTAFERKDSEPTYPIIPVFVDLDPGKIPDRDAVRTATGAYGAKLLDCNGLARRPSESAEAFRRRAACRYVDHAVTALSRRRPNEPVRVAVRSLSDPDDQYDLTFDWRALIDAETRTLVFGGRELIADALASSRESLQGVFHSPKLLLDVDLPLPLAFLLGYEWRITTRIQLSVRQRTGSSFTEIAGDGSAEAQPPPSREVLPGHGPAVVAVSCREGFGNVAANYAARIAAHQLITLHIAGLLDERQMRGLAQACASELQRLNNQGCEKHLLMMGPSALAVLAGAAANATGPVTIPFWNGTEYGGSIVVGGRPTTAMA